MIVECRQKIDKVLPYLSLRLARAMAYLRDTDFESLPDGRHEVEGSDIFVTISSYKTDKRQDCISEAHFKYIDIQYLLSGEELIYHAPLDEKCQTVEQKNIKDDVVIFSDVTNEKEYLLEAGQVVIFFPWDVHRTKCKSGDKSCKNRKAVIKVRAEG